MRILVDPRPISKFVVVCAASQSRFSLQFSQAEPGRRRRANLDFISFGFRNQQNLILAKVSADPYPYSRIELIFSASRGGVWVGFSSAGPGSRRRASLDFDNNCYTKRDNRTFAKGFGGPYPIDNLPVVSPALRGRFWARFS